LAAGQRLPGIIWFYPREFTQQADYERTKYTTNINRFPKCIVAPASSVKLWVSQGYALIEPDNPIWGDSGKMNDNYTRDLRENSMPSSMPSSTPDTSIATTSASAGTATARSASRYARLLGNPNGDERVQPCRIPEPSGQPA